MSCNACERHVCPKCFWGTRYYCPMRKEEPKPSCDRYCAGAKGCTFHTRHSVTDDLICGKHCGCRKKSTTTEFFPAPKEEPLRLACVCCAAYDLHYRENEEVYRRWGFVCSDCADGILGR
jgi:hypothetical protein